MQDFIKEWSHRHLLMPLSAISVDILARPETFWYFNHDFIYFLQYCVVVIKV